MTLAQHLQQLEAEQMRARREVDVISALRHEFPDLEIDRDRWGRTRYMARSANARVDEVLFHRNCGCCADSPVHARPYLKINNGTYVYSNPCNVMIGKPYAYGLGFREYEGWREKYEKAGVNPCIIEAIAKYVAQRGEDYDDV